MNRDWVKSTVGPGTSFRFVGRTAKYGVAEFIICFVYKRGKLQKYIVSQLQQEDTNQWIVETKTEGFTCFAYTHQGLSECKTWAFGWCKEHNGPLVRLYAPREANLITLDYDGIKFSRVESKP